MARVIKARSTSSTRSNSRKSTAKSNNSRSGTRRQATSSVPTRVRTPLCTASELKRHMRTLEAAGDRHSEAQVEHKAAIDNMHDAISAARADGVPLRMITEATGVSAQWIYNMGKHAGRDGSKPAKRGRYSGRLMQEQAKPARRGRPTGSKNRTSSNNSKSTSKRVKIRAR